MIFKQMIVWVIVGATAGLLVDAVVSGKRVGLVIAIVVGIIGGFLGGWLFSLFGFELASGFIPDLIVAFIGGATLLLVLRLIRRRK